MNITIHIDAFIAITIISILGIITIVSTTFAIMMMKKMKSFRIQLEDNNRLLYFNLKDNMDAHTKANACFREIETMREDLNTLSSGLQLKLHQEAENAKRKRFPKPDEVTQITATIKEQISIAATLRSQQRSPLGGALSEITENTCKTYPDIAEDYIVNKCIVIMQDSLV